MSATQGPSSFPATLWSMVHKLGDSSAPDHQALLDRLCTLYWSPLYHYARRQGKSAHDAQDLTQGFFLHLLESELLAKADRTKGKLRTFLLIAFNRYIWGEYDKATAAKRGGKGLQVLALEDAEENFLADKSGLTSPEEAYDRQCAQVTLSAAMDALSNGMEKTGKLAHFQSLKQFLVVSGNEESYTREAGLLGTTLGNYKVMVQRFRQKFKECLKAEVAQTLPEEASADQVHDETMVIIRLAFA